VGEEAIIWDAVRRLASIKAVLETFPKRPFRARPHPCKIGPRLETTMPTKNWLVPLDAIMGALEAAPGGKRFHYPIRHGTMRVGVYAPVGHDPQQPHTQDELYIVIRGRGTFVKDTDRRPFGPGDVIFVEAGVPHRFEDFTPEFATWVVFWGPEGGEKEPG
jgi:mannose-6-phosphate isomerase-like protein (cupin superfamily)